MLPCPCHSGKNYEECCEPYHRGMPAPTALALMRSRFAAYALGLVDYIIATSKSAQSDAKEIEAFCNVTRFAGLEILKVDEQDRAATVKFKAILFQGHHDASFIETSSFIKEGDRWIYTERG